VDLSPRRDLDRLADMRDALTDVKALTADGKQAFQADRSAQQAVAYNLAVLGEAARALSPELRERHPEVPWRDVIAQRNVVVHEYHRLDLDSLWITATQDVPQLDEQLAGIERAEREPPGSAGKT
jgi:uncharacterized protein with HEPN domain